MSGTSTALRGRFVLHAHQYPFVADQAERHGGPGQAPGAAELFLGSLIACAFGIMQRTADERGFGPAQMAANASYQLAAQDRTRFEWIRMGFTVTGLSQADADGLVAAFVAQCPIYNTAARTTPTEITTTVR